MVAVGDVAVNLYQTLKAVPLPQVGAGVAPIALCRLPVTGVQVNEGVRVPAAAQLAWENVFAQRFINKMNTTVVRKVVRNMVFQDLDSK